VLSVVRLTDAFFVRLVETLNILRLNGRASPFFGIKGRERDLRDFVVSLAERLGCLVMRTSTDRALYYFSSR
jgi:hypothetical protein